MNRPARRDRVHTTGSPDRVESRKPYRTPELTEYGSVAKLTQGPLTNQSDGAGGFKMTCL